jgi:carboxyl-terminal processing protease
MQGEYEGIGAWVDTKGDYLTIIEPMPGSPAEAAGLKKGDQIIAVNGEDVSGQSPEDVRLFKVLGPAGTQITLTILRPGVEKPFDVTLTRAHIVVPSVSSKILEGNIGYLQINQFGEKTADEVHTVLQDFQKQHVKGIILDLRNNPGGFTTTARSIASEFIGKGVIWYEEYNDGHRVEYEAESGGLALDIPLVVLVNEYSASASELVAGALQDYGRAKLVGVTTYGKGVVQNWQPLSNGGTLRVTVSRFLSPKGHSIHKTGLTPDIVVKMSEEDYQAGRDPQLEAAIQALNQIIASQP